MVLLKWIQIIGLLRWSKKACENLGLKPYTTTSGGGSDTNVLNANDITAINLGIGEKPPHTLEEHLHIKDLENAARLALDIIKVFG